MVELCIGKQLVIEHQRVETVVFKIWMALKLAKHFRAGHHSQQVHTFCIYSWVPGYGLFGQKFGEKNYFPFF